MRKENTQSLGRGVKILKSLGFDSNLNKTLHDLSATVERRPGISVFDFVSAKEKTRFLRETGTTQAYREILRRHQLKQLHNEHSAEKPVASSLMERNDKRKMANLQQKKFIEKHLNRSIVKIFRPNPSSSMIEKGCYCLHLENRALRKEYNALETRLTRSYKELRGFISKKLH